MATRFFLRNLAGPFASTKLLSSQPGQGMTASDSVGTSGGPATIQVTDGGIGLVWDSPPLKAQTITGAVTFNLWGWESVATANVGFYAEIAELSNAGAFQGDIVTSAQGVELPAGNFGVGPQNWTAALNSPPAIWLDGWRFRVKVFGKDAGGTMLGGKNFNFNYNNLAGLNGDSWIEFADNLSLDVFPTPLHDGPQYLKYLKRKKQYSDITVQSQFEDGGVDSFEHAADAPQRYELDYDGLLDTEADVLDQYWAAHRLVTPFTFYEPRNEPWTHIEGSPVEVYFESYDGDHLKIDSQSRKVVLVKRPA